MEEKTLLFLKPEIVKERKVGEIISIVERNGFKIVGMKLIKLSEENAKEFYKIHKGKPFFESLVRYISSGPIVSLCLKRENAANVLRELVGATNPKEAKEGTIRQKYGKNIETNAVHASAPNEDPEREIEFFFSPDEIFD